MSIATSELQHTCATPDEARSQSSGAATALAASGMHHGSDGDETFASTAICSSTSTYFTAWQLADYRCSARAQYCGHHSQDELWASGRFGPGDTRTASPIGMVLLSRHFAHA